MSITDTKNVLEVFYTKYIFMKPSVQLVSPCIEGAKDGYKMGDKFVVERTVVLIPHFVTICKQLMDEEESTLHR